MHPGDWTFTKALAGRGDLGSNYHEIFKVEEVYYKTDISSLPNYIKNIISSKRNKHIDSLIKLSSEVRN